jgi:phosphoribosylformylglycinamidine (FGAM) synthase PurS component
MTYSEQLSAALDELAAVNELRTFCDNYIANQLLEDLAVALSANQSN